MLDNCQGEEAIDKIKKAPRRARGGKAVNAMPSADRAKLVPGAHARISRGLAIAPALNPFKSEMLPSNFAKRNGGCEHRALRARKSHHGGTESSP